MKRRLDICPGCGAPRDGDGNCEPYPEPAPLPSAGIVRMYGWAKDDETGKDVFRAIVEFPNGPPENLTFGMVWKASPVHIVAES